MMGNDKERVFGKDNVSAGVRPTPPQGNTYSMCIQRVKHQQKRVNVGLEYRLTGFDHVYDGLHQRLKISK